jgi:hypothetical protein
MKLVLLFAAVSCTIPVSNEGPVGCGEEKEAGGIKVQKSVGHSVPFFTFLRCGFNEGWAGYHQSPNFSQSTRKMEMDEWELDEYLKSHYQFDMDEPFRQDGKVSLLIKSFLEEIETATPTELVYQSESEIHFAIEEYQGSVLVFVPDSPKDGEIHKGWIWSWFLERADQELLAPTVVSIGRTGPAHQFPMLGGIEGLDPDSKVFPMVINRQDGISLYNLRMRDGPIPLPLVMRIGICLIRAIRDLHTLKRIVHGFLRPEAIHVRFIEPDECRVEFTHFVKSHFLSTSDETVVVIPGQAERRAVDFPLRLFSPVWEMDPEVEHSSRLADVHRAVQILFWLLHEQIPEYLEGVRTFEEWIKWTSRNEFTLSQPMLNSIARTNQDKERLIFLQGELYKAIDVGDEATGVPAYDRIISILEGIRTASS